jgi:hypothetical protein
MLGIWNGEGMERGWERGGQFTSNLGQGGQDRITPKEGFQVCKREWKGSNKELARGVKQGDCAITVFRLKINHVCEEQDTCV